MAKIESKFSDILDNLGKIHIQDNLKEKQH